MNSREQIQAAWLKQVEAAAERYGATEAKREDIEQIRDMKHSPVVDSPEQISARAQRLAASGKMPVEAIVEAGRAEPADRIATLERIIGASNELQPANFLARGARTAATVARISMIRNGREIPLGTGFLVSPRLLLTNNHVLPDLDTARQVVVDFGAETTIDNDPCLPLRFHLDPDFFVTDEHLDFTLVPVLPRTDGKPPGDVVGWWNRLIMDQGKIVVGEAMNIIGHPMGRLKEIGIRKNQLDLQLDHFLHYSTDTEPGNSGSPVFNDQWEVVALHHSGVPRTDEQGRILRRDGTVWRQGDGDDAIAWTANEGVRISAILRHLACLPRSARDEELLAELGPGCGLAAGPSAAIPHLAPVEEHVEPATPAPTPRESTGLRGGVTARAGAFGGTRHLLFLHGRSQHGRDPELLRREWTAGLNKGLTLAGLSPLDPSDAYFPFYGDRLAALLQPLERTTLAPETMAVDHALAMAPATPPARQLYEEILQNAAADAGMPAEDGPPEDRIEVEGLGSIGSAIVSKLQRQLSWLAARSDLDELIIAQVFRDVSTYLADEQIRQAVLDCVLETVPASGQLTLVSHSLGTVVAMDLLTRLQPQLDVAVLVTLGSPLGLDSVHDKLLVRGPHRPARVGDWLNAWSAVDPITIGCPLRHIWKGQLREIPVDNPKERAHSIAEYLAHPAVAQAIHNGVVPATTGT
ncbi:trypsin-like peptidase domain-containing protein [Nocardia amamiensis]|uniref:Trypsin-like peptidase domain-containing protein n=1 Tax=Nocardia amamiensis TaxID=404578 RepID=A0ABS0CTT3_9NOCA|nr:serine protease [Nocardia amamiensis]MBF6300042.1 trypsin-like peptidase domain-containing protein [Nocardia amamiensis]